MGRAVLTYEDYAALPDDGRRYELHDGELSVTPAPGPRHQAIVGELFVLLRAHVLARGLGRIFVSPVDCILADTTIVQPDLVFVAAADTARITERGIEGPPTLAVEVVTPSTARTDRTTKRQLFARHGVPFYWIVDPADRSLEAWILGGETMQPAGRLVGAEAGALPPFPDLVVSFALVMS